MQWPRWSFKMNIWTDSSGRPREDCGCTVQNLWLWLCYCFQLPGYWVDQGQICECSLSRPHNPVWLYIIQFSVFWGNIVVFSFQVDEASTIRNTDIAKELCLPPVKLHCSSKFSFKVVLPPLPPNICIFNLLIKNTFCSTVLAEDAIKAALADYQLKQEDGQQEAAQSSS